MQVVHWLIEVVSKREVSEVTGKMIHCHHKHASKGEMGNIRRKIINRVIEFISKCKMSEAKSSTLLSKKSFNLSFDENRL